MYGVFFCSFIASTKHTHREIEEEKDEENFHEL